jgi:hypothetical protein
MKWQAHTLHGTRLPIEREGPRRCQVSRDAPGKTTRKSNFAFISPREAFPAMTAKTAYGG